MRIKKKLVTSLRGVFEVNTSAIKADTKLLKEAE